MFNEELLLHLNQLLLLKKMLLKYYYNKKTLVINCSGGSIPVIREKENLIGIYAVINIDFVVAILANKNKTDDILMILTTVPQVAINYFSTEQKGLKTASVVY